MKVIVSIVLVVVFVGQAWAGQVILRNGFTEYSLAQGIGKTSVLAYADALSAIPKDYEHEKNSPQFSSVVDGKYQITLSILPRDEKRKTEYLEIRQSRKRNTVEGFGNSIAEAKNDVRKKIAKTSVIDSWLLGCTIKHENDQKGQLICDPQILGNQYKITAYIFTPNVDSF